MKQFYLCAALACALWQANAQTPVAVGSGSYASFPPTTEYVDWNNDGIMELDYFLYDRPIYVQEGETRPIPTNDWWTSLIADQYSGFLWAYPFMVDAESYGPRIYFPNSFVPDGSNIETGGSIMIKADGFNPAKAIAKDWSDWGVVMGMPDGSKNIDVTMAHGVPFMWFETNGINPKFSYEQGGATYLTAAGTAASFPLTQSFVIQNNGKYYGVHLDGNTTAQIEGQQYATIDLGSAQAFNNVKLNWEGAFASGYAIQVSNDNATWTTLFSETAGNGNLDDITLTGNGRYVRIALYEEGTIFSFSLYEMQVFNGTTLLSQGKPVTVSSTQAPFVKENINDGNLGTRWAADGNVETGLVLNMNNGSGFFVISALPNPAALTTYETYAFNKVVDTDVAYDYDKVAGTVATTWNITTDNLKGQADGNTIQGFLPHLYDNTTHNVNFNGNTYVSPRGPLKTSVGKDFAFTYKFTGVLPSYNSPYMNSTDANPYNANVMFNLLTDYSSKTTYGGDTYWGGKDLVNFAKYTLFAKETGHQAFEAMKLKTRNALVNWLTYTPGETEKFFARYDRWKALIGFNESYGSAEFTDNHFHYGYLIQACAMYGMVDPQFLEDYGDMIKLVAKQYANWDKEDEFLPYFRTFDPWIGHSYAGGTSSVLGNNQESTSEAMQSWTGLFLLGDVLQDDSLLDAAAFGYISESRAALEYWFDWRQNNLPAAYAHNMVGILSNMGFAYGTFFSANPLHIHGIQYLPVNPGFKYLAEDTEWAAQEYDDMMAETLASEGFDNVNDFGDDWAHVALGFRLLWDPEYVAGYIAENMDLPQADPKYIMNYDVSGMTYYYTHAGQNLGDFSFAYHTDFPSSSVFTEDGTFSHAVAYNPTASEKTCTIYNNSNEVVATFQVPAYTLKTYPELPTTGQEPTGCYGLVPAGATASTGVAGEAIDGNMGSRWESQFTDPQWIQIDMGTLSTVNTVAIHWEAANAKDYTFKGSVDGIEWTTIGTYINMPEGNRTDNIDVNGNYRYLRVDGTARNLTYGYSIFEFDICGLAFLDTDNHQLTQTVSMYPNPAQGFVNIVAEDSAQAIIYNMNGAVVLKHDLIAGENTIKLSGLATGVYLVKVGNKTSRLVIK